MFHSFFVVIGLCCTCGLSAIDLSSTRSKSLHFNPGGEDGVLYYGDFDATDVVTNSQAGVYGGYLDNGVVSTFDYTVGWDFTGNLDNPISSYSYYYRNDNRTYSTGNDFLFSYMDEIGGSFGTIFCENIVDATHKQVYFQPYFDIDSLYSNTESSYLDERICYFSLTLTYTSSQLNTFNIGVDAYKGVPTFLCEHIINSNPALYPIRVSTSDATLIDNLSFQYNSYSQNYDFTIQFPIFPIGLTNTYQGFPNLDFYNSTTYYNRTLAPFFMFNVANSSASIKPYNVRYSLQWVRDDALAEAYDEGYSDGNANGYQQGYQAGINSVPTSNTWLGMFGAVADTPILMLRSFFNFDLFGFNVLSIVLSLLTSLFVIYIVKKFI